MSPAFQYRLVLHSTSHRVLLGSLFLHRYQAFLVVTSHCPSYVDGMRGSDFSVIVSLLLLCLFTGVADAKAGAAGSQGGQTEKRVELIPKAPRDCFQKDVLLCMGRLCFIHLPLYLVTLASTLCAGTQGRPRSQSPAVDLQASDDQSRRWQMQHRFSPIAGEG